MKNITSLILASVFALSLSGCTTTEQTAIGGAAAGALIGQVAGKDTKATLIGAGIGAVSGAVIGKSMEKQGYCQYRNNQGAIYEAPCPQ
jgi:surface antigen